MNTPTHEHAKTTLSKHYNKKLTTSKSYKKTYGHVLLHYNACKTDKMSEKKKPILSVFLYQREQTQGNQRSMGHCHISNKVKVNEAAYIWTSNT